ncbi:hypothetical protein EDB92DRAFT_563502 [Lactarius akahatsu]|uniref:Uncharacterized protein n=1 Tax=Lactarius akahatsu TaxID=416441 RepID=A0AAD4LHE6_9AGAM|nr:hypothetical protein EDB92DRAFT_563502 [Lactarius akahatsu]
MPNDSSFLYAPCCQNDPLRSVHPPSGTHGNVPRPNGHQPGVNYAGPYHSGNDANFGDWGPQYHDNVWNEGPPPPSTNSEGQYAYQGSPNVDYAPPGSAQHHFAAPGPLLLEYHMPPAYVRTLSLSFTLCSRRVCMVSNRVRTQGIPNDGHAPRIAMPDVADPFSRNIPNPDPSRTSAVEDLKRLANRYLHNPDSLVDTLRVGLSPSGGRFTVMILLEVDNII